MIKAYFFDWIDTLGYTNGKNYTRILLSREQHHSLLTKKFKDSDIPEKYRKQIRLHLMNEKHFIYQDTKSVINTLKESGYKLAIVSNMYDIAATRIRRLFSDFLNKFDIITFSGEVGLRKPDPKMFNYTLDELNKIYHSDISPDEVIMIGDKQDKDIEPALRLGMQARIIDRTKQTLVDFIE